MGEIKGSILLLGGGGGMGMADNNISHAWVYAIDQCTTYLGLGGNTGAESLNLSSLLSTIALAN